MTTARLPDPRMGVGRGRDGPLLTGSGRPPHGSQRAELPHWALASGTSVKPLGWPWMQNAGGRKPSLGQPAHPTMRNPADLTGASQ